MASKSDSQPAILGLFEKRIDGDDALLELAQMRFREAGLGAEMHAGAPDQLDHLLRFRPAPKTPVVVHLPRDFDLLDPTNRQRIVEIATRFAGRISGLVIHDRADLPGRISEYIGAATRLNSQLVDAGLRGSRPGPLLFVEYAAGLAPADFARFFESIRGLPHVSACLDTGHVGIWQIRQTFAAMHPGQDVCALKSQPPELDHLMDDVEAATHSALPCVLGLIQQLGTLGKPLHFHLHDGHPLSAFSPFGVSDHLGFLGDIPLRREYRGRKTTPLMYGPGGLGQMATQAVRTFGPDRVSFTLEIHPTFDQLPLANTAPLFSHWLDKTNAEKMHHWISLLVQNQRALVRSYG